MYDSLVSPQESGIVKVFNNRVNEILGEIHPLEKGANGDISKIMKERSLAAGKDEKEEPSDREQISRIAEQMAAYALLYDVPFCYLLPAQELLPDNSVRFFHLDPNWLFSLMDGALSPGRVSELDFDHDRDTAYMAFAMAIEESEKIRRILQHRTPLEIIQKSDLSSSSFIPEICTGFLLRSPLVADWRGLEFNAYGKDGQNPLRALRIETLADDVLIALFLGEIYSFTLCQPPEGLNYGFERDENDNLRAGLRDPVSGKMDGKTLFGIKEKGNRVIDFAETAVNISNMLNKEVSSFDSASMALQLIQTAATLEVNVHPEQKGE